MLNIHRIIQTNAFSNVVLQCGPMAGINIAQWAQWYWLTALLYIYIILKTIQPTLPLFIKYLWRHDLNTCSTKTFSNGRIKHSPMRSMILTNSSFIYIYHPEENTAYTSTVHQISLKTRSEPMIHQDLLQWQEQT